MIYIDDRDYEIFGELEGGLTFVNKQLGTDYSVNQINACITHLYAGKDIVYKGSLQQCCFIAIGMVLIAKKLKEKG